MTIGLATPGVIRLRATYDDDQEQSFVWRIYVRDEPLGEDDQGQRDYPVIGSLRAAGEACWGDIDLSAVVTSVPAGIEGDALHEAIRDSIAAETLYDFGRSHLNSLFGTLGATLQLPYQSPDLKVETIAVTRSGSDEQ